jgi:hypothetical protein
MYQTKVVEENETQILYLVHVLVHLAVLKIVKYSYAMRSFPNLHIHQSAVV